jgi:hypothetical protein
VPARQGKPNGKSPSPTDMKIKEYLATGLPYIARSGTSITIRSNRYSAVPVSTRQMLKAGLLCTSPVRLRTDILSRVIRYFIGDTVNFHPTQPGRSTASQNGAPGEMELSGRQKELTHSPSWIFCCSTERTFMRVQWGSAHLCTVQQTAVG